ncbi:hypothetical protein ACFPIJ_52460 [Dactylosporangium cerinum]|uniref:Uncharacterized protein n=1 Tax=Dactylosporangium cerinum TaxID=1434730 RepID=A0ABV9WGH4_9ACTN
MRLTFLGKESQGGQSPTLYATDRQTYVVQGWRVPGEATSVEIPHGLLRFLEAETDLAAALRDTGANTYCLSGAPVTDEAALAQMDLPAHETCVEVGKAKRVAH